MIRFRLKEVLAVRKISISHLAQQTGISRANIYRLYKDKAENFNRSTLDKLCEALSCLPSDLFEYIPRAQEGDPASDGATWLKPNEEKRRKSQE